MEVVVAALNQEKALVGAFSVIVQPVVEPMDRFAALHNIPRLRCCPPVLAWFLWNSEVTSSTATGAELAASAHTLDLASARDKASTAEEAGLLLVFSQFTFILLFPVHLLVLETKVIRMFPKISQSWRRPLLGPSPG